MHTVANGHKLAIDSWYVSLAFIRNTPPQRSWPQEKPELPVNLGIKFSL